MADHLDATVGAQIERLTKNANAQEAALVTEYHGMPLAVENGIIKPRLDLLQRPLIRKEQVAIKSVDSFISYVNDHVDTLIQSVLYADEEANAFGVIFDYEDVSGALNGQHRAKLNLETTLAFDAWSEQNDKGMSQEDFALFLEENAGDIVEPDAATMLQIATELRATKDVTFDSKVKLENGSHVFAYKEEVKGTFQAGKADIPKSFYIAVTIYRGQPESYKLECKLRYRITDSGKLTLWYSIPLLDRSLETAFEDVQKQIAEGLNQNVKKYEAKITF